MLLAGCAVLSSRMAVPGGGGRAHGRQAQEVPSVPRMRLPEGEKVDGKSEEGGKEGQVRGSERQGERARERESERERGRERERERARGGDRGK
eukprot:1185248-Rhodomonas_salina.4